MEVIAPPPAAAPRIAATEDVGSLPLFHLYAEHVSMSPPAVTAGCEILQVCKYRPHPSKLCPFTGIIISLES